MPQTEASPSLVLFSGGRDSSLAACLEARGVESLLLMTGKTGATIETDIVATRVREIEDAFPAVSVRWVKTHSAGIFRRVALADIESDFARFKTNLILLGHQLALQAEAVVCALRAGSTRVVSGFSSYQSEEFMEQSPIAVDMARAFFADYGLDFVTPIMNYTSLDEVKFQLLDFGVTTKSLEAVSLFADTFSPATQEAIAAYVEAKLPVCRAYVELKLAT